MANPKVDIQITANEGLAVIGIRIPRSTAAADIDAVVNRLMGEIARIDKQDPQKLAQSLYTAREQAHNQTTLGWVFRYRYTDPDFPEKLDKALRSIPVIDSANTRTLN